MLRPRGEARQAPAAPGVLRPRYCPGRPRPTAWGGCGSRIAAGPWAPCSADGLWAPEVGPSFGEGDPCFSTRSPLRVVCDTQPPQPTPRPSTDSAGNGQAGGPGPSLHGGEASLTEWPLAPGLQAHHASSEPPPLRMALRRGPGPTPGAAAHLHSARLAGRQTLVTGPGRACGQVGTGAKPGRCRR